MHGHLIWNSVSMTTGKKYNSPKSNWKNHLQPITNKYCDELGLSIMPAEYSKNPKNISRDKWEKEMSMKEIILRDAKMCAYAAGNVEHFKYLMKISDLSYFFGPGADSVQINPIQYPDRKVVERCAMIRDFGDRTELVLEMWSRVKGDNLNTGIVLLIFAVFGILFVWIVWKRISIYKQKKRHHRRRRRIRR